MLEIAVTSTRVAPSGTPTPGTTSRSGLDCRPPAGRWRLRWKLSVGLPFLGILLLLTVIFAAAQGPAPVSYASAGAILLNELGVPLGGFSAVDQRIVEQIRLPRVLVGLLVGLALGVAGSVLQGLFRNPLADPGIIGVSSGGALGAVLAISTGLAATSRLAVPAAALAGAMLVAFAVFAIGMRRGPGAMLSVVLAGIALGALTSALTSLAISLTEDLERNREILFWLLGGLDNRGWDHVRIVVIPVLLGTVLCLAAARELNLLLLGEESALSLGVPVGALRILLLIVAAGMTAIAVSVSGIINFVGLVVPHVVRLLVGYDHRLVIPFSGMAGAIFLVLADVVARTAATPAELRVGVVTSAVGAPFFLYLVFRQARGHARGSTL